MTTLKGIFDQKPQQQRNFLLENIKRVKFKSTVNGQKDNKPETTRKVHLKVTKCAPIKSTNSLTVSPCPSLKKPGVTHVEDRFIKKSLPQEINNGHSCLCTSGKESSKRSKQGKLSSKTVHYIHQENVPFEWTEMCPSLVSHSICHQGVQTDEYDGNTIVTRTTKPPKGEENSAHESPHGLELGNTLNHITNSVKIDQSITMDKSEERCLEACKSEGICDVRECGSLLNVVRNNKSEKELFEEVDVPGISHQISAKESINNTDQVPDLKNMKISSSGSSRKHQCVSSDLPSSYQKGVIPKYLTRRKHEQLMEATQVKAVDPSCPSGHVVMPESERKETLDLILKNYNELVTELNKMPVRTDTLKMKHRKIDLERQLDKLEEGIRVFSRSRVYIKLND